MWGLTDRGGVSVAVEVASVFAMLPVLVAIASVVLAPMVVLVEARAMVVARSAGGVFPIYMVDVGAVLPADGTVEVVCVAVFAPLSGER